MASMWRRAMVYLGLQDDEDYDEYVYDDYFEEENETREPARVAAGRPEAREPRETREVRPVREVVTPAGSGAVRPLPRDDAPEVVAQRPVVRAVSPSAASVHVVEPAGFNDAQELGDRLKANQPVILNLQGLSKELQRRLIDFSSGITYAVGGSMSRVADQVFLLTPSNVEVSQEEKERLQARGLYHA